jgi:LuxR family transcriptional regulator, maltose regulon positive regulatory protein
VAGRTAEPKCRAGTFPASSLRVAGGTRWRAGNPPDWPVTAPAQSGVPADVRFPEAKFRPTTLPPTLVTRSALHDQLTAGEGQPLTVVVGSAGSGKSVLLSSWAAARAPRVTCWLSCDEADADPVRFWAGFVVAVRVVVPGFGAGAADILATHRVVSADVIASIANGAGKLPAGSVIIVDDFHAAAGVTRSMTHLVERWPAGIVQLVL